MNSGLLQAAIQNGGETLLFWYRNLWDSREMVAHGYVIFTLN